MRLLRIVPSLSQLALQRLYSDKEGGGVDVSSHKLDTTTVNKLIVERVDFGLANIRECRHTLHLQGRLSNIGTRSIAELNMQPGAERLHICTFI